MNIILLSGGSGKRLWPLSNDTRSKQFLKLLKNDEGEFESMVQRVYRQVKKAGIEANIVVATGASQVDSIKSQLGNNVDIVLEPERRDTFPAIALSSAYLALEKKVDLNEVVLVLPVDPYADIEYFYMLIEMEKAVKRRVAEMILMGIKPTYPSEKYGYIMPVQEDGAYFGIHQVARFTEKPTKDVAEQLIDEGAYWNGGVFAFKLGFLMGIVNKYMDTADIEDFSSFEEIRRHYGAFKKISFDYEVVEKAPSIAMIPYEGGWKDLGTWNTLTEEMDEESIGLVTVGEDTVNTNVINELSIPIVVLGAKDMIVAASPDGILVSDKQSSSYLKPYVDGINERPMYEERRWGNYKVLDYIQYEDGTKSLTKHLTIKAGESISYQVHQMRDEIWNIVDGTGDLLIDGHIRNVRRGDVAYIMKGQKHAMHAHGGSDLHFIEVQIGTELAETDIERFEWEW
jgi:mannose-1-phosphate guanylyltransferase